MIKNFSSFSKASGFQSLYALQQEIMFLFGPGHKCSESIFDSTRALRSSLVKRCLPRTARFRTGIKKSLFTLLMLSAAVSFPVQAHRGASDEIDTCQILVGFEKVHFTAYTPTFTQNEEYCRSIPNVGPTNLVFDYEGKGLRKISVEFEVTKEPEGTRVFYQEPKKIKTGTVNGTVDFSQFGAGKYLAHVTIVHEGKTLDTHLPFWVGVEAESEGFLSDPMFGKLLLTFTIIAALLYFLLQLYKAKDEKNSSSEQP